MRKRYYWYCPSLISVYQLFEYCVMNELFYVN
jgi:hypothetical protein